MQEGGRPLLHRDMEQQGKDNFTKTTEWCRAGSGGWEPAPAAALPARRAAARPTD
ncbi:hypothetical protein D3C75_1080330 [compost metagenome]